MSAPLQCSDCRKVLVERIDADPGGYCVCVDCFDALREAVTAALEPLRVDTPREMRRNGRPVRAHMVLPPPHPLQPI